MPIDKKGSGSSSGGTAQIQASQMPDLYDPNKTIRHVYDCNTNAGGTAPAIRLTYSAIRAVFE